jgi:hypothetical protein
MQLLAKEGSRELETSSSSSPEPTNEAVHSVPRLVADKRDYGDPEAFRRAVKAMRETDTRTLVVRIATTGDPLLLWAIHIVLDGRGVAPALRWPANDASPQGEYLTWLADMFWFAKRNHGHKPSYRGWQGLFTHPTASLKWHATAYRQYLFVAARYSIAHWCSKGIGLTEPQRSQLLTLPTNAMQSDRRQLCPERFEALQDRIASYAMQHPDRSRRHSPHAVANRRALLWRVFVLSARNHTATAMNWQLLTGESLSRQAVSKQIAMVAEMARRGATN